MEGVKTLKSEIASTLGAVSTDGVEVESDVSSTSPSGASIYGAFKSISGGI